MHLIADSGSTKTDWALINQEGDVMKIQSVGLNPIYLSEDKIVTLLNQIQAFQTHKYSINKVNFYGAGCLSKEHCQLVENAIKTVFENAKTIRVNNDLLGAVHATCWNEPGIVGILGTGSNACYFDGKNIHQKTAALGYILGDEGSGAYFGKILIQKILYGLLPNDVITDFEQAYSLDKSKIIKSVYQEERPNVFLASFMPFYEKHRHVLELKHMLKAGFKSYISNHILCYDEVAELPIHFVGSIAKIFYPELLEVASYMDLELGKIVQSPIDELVKG